MRMRMHHKVLNSEHEVLGRTSDVYCLSYVSFQLEGCELLIRLFSELLVCVIFQKNILALFCLLAVTTEFGTAAVI
jgi:hypothetical protein